MIKKLGILPLILAASAYADGYPDGSDIGTPEMAKCSAAALKIDIKIWEQWYTALEKRYAIIYKNKSKKELQSYTIERVMDKKRSLNSLGIDSKRAYKNYFELNCAGEI